MGWDAERVSGGLAVASVDAVASAIVPEGSSSVRSITSTSVLAASLAAADDRRVLVRLPSLDGGGGAGDCATAEDEPCGAFGGRVGTLAPSIAWIIEMPLLWPTAPRFLALVEVADSLEAAMRARLRNDFTSRVGFAEVELPLWGSWDDEAMLVIPGVSG